MEVLAYDRLEPSKNKQAAKQWIDVTGLLRTRWEGTTLLTLK
jgi:hypothetical protein